MPKKPFCLVVPILQRQRVALVQLDCVKFQRLFAAACPEGFHGGTADNGEVEVQVKSLRLAPFDCWNQKPILNVVVLLVIACGVDLMVAVLRLGVHGFLEPLKLSTHSFFQKSSLFRGMEGKAIPRQKAIWRHQKLRCPIGTRCPPATICRRLVADVRPWTCQKNAPEWEAH